MVRVHRQKGDDRSRSSGSQRRWLCGAGSPHTLYGARLWATSVFGLSSGRGHVIAGAHEHANRRWKTSPVCAGGAFCLLHTSLHSQVQAVLPHRWRECRRLRPGAFSRGAVISFDFSLENHLCPGFTPATAACVCSAPGTILHLHPRARVRDRRRGEPFVSSSSYCSSSPDVIRADAVA